MFGKGKSIWWWKFLPNLNSSDILNTMKIKPTDKVSVKVRAESYQMGGVSTKTYTGVWEKVLNKISSVHSYGWVVGVDEDGDVLSCEDVPYNTNNSKFTGVIRNCSNNS